MTGVAPLANDLRRIVSGPVLAGVRLAGYTSLGIGGPAEILCEPVTGDEVAMLLAFARARGLPVTVLGYGTNVLVSDAGAPGVVLVIGRRMGGFGHQDCRWWAGAGERLRTLAAAAAGRGFAGLEFGVGIPGSVGGAVVVNAGAHGRSVLDSLRWVDLVRPDGVLERIPAEAIARSYRWTSLEDSGSVVTAAGFLLSVVDRSRLRREVSAQLQRRKARHPLATQNAGSFFKNPSPDTPAGSLIDQAGCKGWRRGPAVVSELHANFIINEGGATAADVLALAAAVREAVQREFGTALELEVRLVGFPCTDGREWWRWTGT